MAKNLSIVAQGISGAEGKLLGYNVTDNGIYTPAIGDVARDTTATYVAQDGTIKTAAENVARVDYTNGVAELLLEPESTNLVTYSEDFSQSYWGKTNASVQSGYASPNGDNSAFKLIPNNGQGGNRSIGKAIDGLSGKYTFSIYAKESGFRYVHLRLRNSPNRQMVFDFQTEAFVFYGSGGFFVEGTMQKVGDFYRLSFTADADESDIIGQLFFSISVSQDGGNSTQFNGNGVDGVIIANAQLEALPYATSYIPTNGAIATRGADSLTNFGSEQIIDSESGILFFEGSGILFATSMISLGLDQNNVYRFAFSTSGTAIFSTRVGSSNVTSLNNTVVYAFENHKYICKYSNGNTEFYVDGVLIESSSETYNMPQGNSIMFTQGNATTNPFYGRVRQVKHLPYNTDITTL